MSRLPPAGEIVYAESGYLGPHVPTNGAAPPVSYYWGMWQGDNLVVKAIDAEAATNHPSDAPFQVDLGEEPGRILGVVRGLGDYHGGKPVTRPPRL